MVKQIWLVRHGQSQAQTGVSDDHLDPPLSDLSLDCILISPLRRAWCTYLSAFTTS